MEKVFKHRKTGELAYYKDGIFKQGNCAVEIGVEPSSEFWNEVLFITDDGVEMFEGGVYYVPQRKENGDLIGTILEFQANNFIGNNEDVKRFSTENSAKEWIRNNKKIYSLNDMVRIAGHWAYIKGVVKPEHVLKTVEKWK